MFFSIFDGPSRSTKIDAPMAAEATTLPGSAAVFARGAVPIRCIRFRFPIFAKRERERERTYFLIYSKYD